MARIRTIKPEFWTDANMVQLPHFVRLFYIALWNAADDHGFIADEPERLAMEFMPRENQLDVEEAIQLLLACDRLEWFVGETGKSFYKIAKWTDHQRVDHPSNSKILRDDYKKVVIAPDIRRTVAEKYGCKPGEAISASCFYCGAPGRIHWFKKRDEQPSKWVVFPGLELDHLEAEASGGDTDAVNIVLACRSCNRSKGTTHWFEFLSSSGFARIREKRRGLSLERKGTGNREQGTFSCGLSATKPNGAGTASKPTEMTSPTERPTVEPTASPTAESKPTALGYSESFESFWTAYPNRGGRKRGKQKSFSLWKLVHVANRQLVVQAAANYAASRESKEGFARDPERFLKSDWWREWLESEAVSKPPSRVPTDDDLKNWNPVDGGLRT